MKELGRRKRVTLFPLALIAFLLVSSWSKGTVVVSCHDLGGGVAEIRYDASDESVLVRAFALDITVGSGATIESVFDYKVGESTSADPGYGFFPGTIVYEDGIVVDWGTPVAPADDPGALPGLGSYGITIEMGSLYDGIENAPLVTDTLLNFSIDWHGAPEVIVDISLNELRGGVILEDATIPEVDLIGCVLVPEPMTIGLLGLGALFLRRRK